MTVPRKEATNNKRRRLCEEVTEEDLVKSIDELDLTRKNMKKSQLDTEIDNDLLSEHDTDNVHDTNNAKLDSTNTHKSSEMTLDNGDEEDEEEINIIVEPQNGKSLQEDTLTHIDNTLSALKSDIEAQSGTQAQIEIVNQNLVLLGSIVGRVETELSEPQTIRNAMENINNNILGSHNVAGSSSALFANGLKQVADDLRILMDMVKKGLFSVSGSLPGQQTETAIIPSIQVITEEIKHLKAVGETRASAEMLRQGIEGLAGSTPSLLGTGLKQIDDHIRAVNEKLDIVFGSLPALQTKSDADKSTAAMQEEIKQLRTLITTRVPTPAQASLARNLTEISTKQDTIKRFFEFKRSRFPAQPVPSINPQTQINPHDRVALLDGVLFEVYMYAHWKEQRIFTSTITLLAKNCTTFTRLDDLASKMMMPEFLAVLKSMGYRSDDVTKLWRAVRLHIPDIEEPDGYKFPVFGWNDHADMMYRTWIDRNIIQPKVLRAHISFGLELFTEDQYEEAVEFEDLVNRVEKKEKVSTRYFCP